MEKENILLSLTIVHYFLHVLMFLKSVVVRGFESRSGLTKGDTIGICCFSAKHAVLRSKYNEWLALNQDNMFEWSNTSTTDCCFSEIAL